MNNQLEVVLLLQEKKATQIQQKALKHHQEKIRILQQHQEEYQLKIVLKQFHFSIYKENFIFFLYKNKIHLKSKAKKHSPKITFNKTKDINIKLISN